MVLDGSPQRGAAAGFSAVAALRVLVIRGRAAFSGVGVGAAGVSAVGFRFAGFGGTHGGRCSRSCGSPSSSRS